MANLNKELGVTKKKMFYSGNYYIGDKKDAYTMLNDGSVTYGYGCRDSNFDIIVPDFCELFSQARGNILNTLRLMSAEKVVTEKKITTRKHLHFQNEICF